MFAYIALLTGGREPAVKCTDTLFHTLTTLTNNSVAAHKNLLAGPLTCRQAGGAAAAVRGGGRAHRAGAGGRRVDRAHLLLVPRLLRPRA